MIHTLFCMILIMFNQGGISYLNRFWLILVSIH